VLDALCSELNYWRGDFRHDSMIFQCCMEDLRINPEALLFQIESSHSVEELKASVLSAAKIEDINDGYNPESVKPAPTLSLSPPASTF
ncbi:MAG: hypothetical protein VX411_02795, partial [Pseudomonadota bacterium]|nr:hypothetical protein [Pseudomonadota bacterium]